MSFQVFMYLVFLLSWKYILKNVLFRFPYIFLSIQVNGNLNIISYQDSLKHLLCITWIGVNDDMFFVFGWTIPHKLIEGICLCRLLTRIWKRAYMCLMEENVLKCLYVVALTCVPPPESWTSALGLSHWESGRCRSHDSLQTPLVLGFFPLPKHKDKITNETSVNMNLRLNKSVNKPILVNLTLSK